jgi:hypothetical protein
MAAAPLRDRLPFFVQSCLVKRIAVRNLIPDRMLVKRARGNRG